MLMFSIVILANELSNMMFQPEMLPHIPLDFQQYDILAPHPAHDIRVKYGLFLITFSWYCDWLWW